MWYKSFFFVSNINKNSKWMTRLFVYCTDKKFFFICLNSLSKWKKCERKIYFNWKKSCKTCREITSLADSWLILLLFIVGFFLLFFVIVFELDDGLAIRNDYFSSSFADFCGDVDVDPVPVPLVAPVQPVLRANFSSNLDFYSCH